MSHTATMDLKIKDKEALKKAVEVLGLSMREGTFKLFSTEEKGIGIDLPGWRYPVVVKDDGTVAYDNYNGRWGDEKELYKLKARYGAEKAKIEARKRGYKVKEIQKDSKIYLELYR